MTPPPDVKIAELLRELFDLDELQRFLRSQYREVADGLPSHLGLASLAHAAAEALARRNLIDDTLFDRLRAERPRCTTQIAGATRRYRQAAARQVRSRRVTIAGVVAGTGMVAGIVAVVWTRLPTGTPGCDVMHGCVEPTLVQPPDGELAARQAAPTSPVCRAGMVLIRHDSVGTLCLDRSEVTRRQFCSFAPRAPQCTGQSKLERPTFPVTHVRPRDAAAYCGALGLRLPQRREMTAVVRLEIGGRALANMLPAMNVCGDECAKQEDREPLDFAHRDSHKETSPVGSYRQAFGSPLGLDDIFGNVRELVTDGDRYFACGTSYANAQLADLQPELCTDPKNRPLTDTASAPFIGFRCAGEPTPP